MKTTMLSIVTGLLITVVFSYSVFAQSSANYRIQSSTVGVAGGPLSSSTYKTKAILGQTTPRTDSAYPPQSADYLLHAGFWYTLQQDRDLDGINDNADNCPNTPNGPLWGSCSAASDKPLIACTSSADCVIGCSNNGECMMGQEDADGDGVGDLCDHCPDDSDKTEPGTCGCNISDTDSDNDLIADCYDSCPYDPQNDADADGWCADVDNCPASCNVNQSDTDNDGIGDVCDPDPGCGVGCDKTPCEQEC